MAKDRARRLRRQLVTTALMGSLASFVIVGSSSVVTNPPLPATLSDQTASFGGLTQANAGAYQIVADNGSPITGASLTGGTASSVAVSASGLITPTANAGLANQNGNTLTISSDQGVATVTLSITADAYSAATEAEANTAFAAVKAGSSATTVALRNGDYDLSAFTGLPGDYTGKELTLTSADEAQGARMLNTSLNLGNSSYITLSDLDFHQTRDYIDNVANIYMLECNGSNITMDGCLWRGDEIPLAVMLDGTTTYPAGYPAPFLFDFQDMVGPFTISNSVFEYYNRFELPIIGGSSVVDSTFRYFYLDGIRFSATPNTNGGDILVRDVDIHGSFGKYNEAGPATPHPDWVQSFNKSNIEHGGAKVGLTLRRVCGWPGELRGDQGQGFFLYGGGWGRLTVDACAIMVQSVHGLSGRMDDVVVVNTTFVETAGVAGAEYRNINDDHTATFYKTVFGGLIKDDLAEGETIEIIESNANKNQATFAGPLSPTTRQELLDSIVIVPGNSAEGRGAVDASGNLLPASPIPRPAAAPTATNTGEAMDVSYSVPSDLDGGTVASYDLRWREVGTEAWTYVTGAGTTENISGLALGFYETQTRPVMTTGNPGHWSAMATVEVLAASASEFDFDATPTGSASSIVAIPGGWRVTFGGAGQTVAWARGAQLTDGVAYTLNADILSDTTGTDSIRARMSTASSLGNTRGMSSYYSPTASVLLDDTTAALTPQSTGTWVGFRNYGGAQVVDFTDLSVTVA